MSRPGWSGGAPSGGGNIDTFNMVPVLEGLRKALPRSDVVYAVGSSLSAARHWNVVQRHEWAVAADFAATAPSVPYAPDFEPTTVAAGTQGLEATYFPTARLEGSAAFSRLDFALNHHFFALGPDPARLPGGVFSARFRGLATPPATATRGRWGVLVHTGSDGEVRVSLEVDGVALVDTFPNASAPTVSGPFAFEAGRAYDVAVNYSQSHSWNDGPAVALLWSLAEEDGDDELAKATRLMDAADAVVAVVGGANNLRAPDGGNDSTEGEGVDRASLALTGRQRDLVDAALASASKSGAPLAVVLVDGKPTAEPLLKTAPAVLAAFNGGQAQGDAIAAVLVGAANPSGRLPLSFPASADVLPVFYDRKPSSARSGWCDVAESVLWAFGHGLSYSNVTYADVSVVPETASAATDEVLVRFTLAHAGGPPVVEVPQVYVRDVVSSVTTPLRSLKAFARVDLAPGETRRVELAISLDELRVLDRTMAWVLEPGTFEVYVGPASDDTPLGASFDVVSD